jgi:metallo-beta-lactamase family protein
MVKVQFLGAAHTVTGSKFYLETPDLNIMVDCGMFQGLKELREINWQPLPISCAKIDLVLLTHGHLDHTGYLPRLVKEGFKGKILGTNPTLAIAEIILRDSANIHEEEAEKANKEGYSMHDPALPYYTEAEAEDAIQLFQSIILDEWTILSANIRCRFNYIGHILGATYIELDIGGKLYVFSGDIGRSDDLILDVPKRPEWADFLFVESTYGNKLHPDEKVEEKLIELAHNTLYQKGNLLIPSFAVERLQLVMYLLWRLYQKNKIPNIPIFIDSPMGSDVLTLFQRFSSWHKLPAKDFSAMCRHMHIVRSYKDTWKTIDDPRPKIVIAGSGMVTGGRILTYLKQLVNKTSTTVLLIGYQAEGTRGRLLLEGTHELKLFGKYHEVKAKVAHIESLSAHADQKELVHWLGAIKNIPENVFLIHGEPTALDCFRSKIKDVYGWHVTIPKLYESFSIT